MNAVILYYKYVTLPDPAAEHQAQRALCERLGLKGRIMLASEGINGTLAGPTEAIDEYIATMAKHPQFFDIAYKRDNNTHVPFPRLRIKVRSEIVTLGVPVDPSQSATKLTPSQFHELLADPEVVLFDARNNYESAIGRFKGAITPNIDLFKDLPEALPQYDNLKTKKVVTYCTGGIRCEKASALMKQQGFTNIYQLEGGIIEYAKAYPEGAFEGDLFVFDDRMSVRFTEQTKLLQKCRQCAAPSNTYVNCANPACNQLMIVCPQCKATGITCSQACATVAA